LQQPRLTEEEYAELLEQTESHQQYLSDLLQAGDQASRSSLHAAAAEAFAIALTMKPAEPYIVQQLALHTYKSQKPSELSALIDGLTIISQIKPDQSNDPETLGITGALHKRIWLLTKDRTQLDAAIRYYSRGYEIRRDYYNGENLAACFDYRAEVQSDPNERQFDEMSARKVRSSLIALLTAMVASLSFVERSDRRWVYATLANCSYALGLSEQGQGYEDLFFAESPAKWEADSYRAGKLPLTMLASNS
jgi:hypothetical protein